MRSVWAAAVIALAACGGGSKEKTPPSAASEARYVGSQACRSCHAETWSTFSHTGMGQSSYPLATAPVIEDWTARNSFETRTGLRYTLLRRDGKYFMRQAALAAGGREVGVDERELIRVIGSGNHSRTYLVALGDKLFQAPACWYTKDAVWDLCPGYEDNNDYFSREIDRTCVFCHNARMTRKGDARNAYVEPIPDGIDCERCHGPGSAHIERWARGDIPTGEGDPSIVNPRRLTSTLRMQICFQCHLGDSKSTERVARLDAALEDWRPGRPITSAMVPFRFSEATRHDFGLSAQVDRLLLSRCYLESGGRMECVTCHDPHLTVYRKDKPADFFTSKCLSCHERGACTAPAAARNATRPADDCVACHMRKAEPSDHRHADFTDHWIRKRIDEPREPRARFDVEPYLTDSFAAFSAAEKAFYRGRAISLRALSVPPAIQRGMWPDAGRAFQDSIGAGMTDPDAWFFLGKALQAQGKRRDAASAFQTAHEKDPRAHDPAFSYGQSLLAQNQLDDAERVFTAMTRDHPESAAPWAELGRCRAQHGDYTGALDDFRKAIALEPWTASLHENAAMMLSALERHSEAMAEASDALRLDPAGARVRSTYAAIAARAR